MKTIKGLGGDCTCECEDDCEIVACANASTNAASQEINIFRFSGSPIVYDDTHSGTGLVWGADLVRAFDAPAFDSCMQVNVLMQRYSSSPTLSLRARIQLTNSDGSCVYYDATETFLDGSPFSPYGAHFLRPSPPIVIPANRGMKLTVTPISGTNLQPTPTTWRTFQWYAWPYYDALPPP